MQKTCKVCGKEFDAQQPHYQLCPKCHREQPTSHQAGQQAQSGRASTSLPKDYLQQGYFDAEGHIFSELVCKVPEEIAKSLGIGGVTSTQLRRFYNKSKAAEQRLNAGETFRGVVPTLLELKQHAANSVGRAQGDEQRGLEFLKQFLDSNVDLAVQSEKAFRKGFLLHFQGVLAYFKYHHPKK